MMLNESNVYVIICVLIVVNTRVMHRLCICNKVFFVVDMGIK